MSNLFKKLTLSFLASLVLLFSFAPYLSVLAQPPTGGNPTNPDPSAPSAGTWYNQDYFSWFNKVYAPGTESEIFGERYTAAQVQWVIYGLFAFIMNSTGNAEVLSCVLSNTADISNCTDAIQNLVSQLPQSSAIASNDKSLLSLVFADRPISGIGYVKEKVNSFRLIPEAKAQTVGFGFSALSPIQDMWRGTRNVAFGLFVLASIIFAFMIMFRVKINPQTVITVQSAIPKVITALILVTFSYAIAGFLIDLMYVVIGLISAILSTFVPSWVSAVSGAAGNPFSPSGIFNFLVYGQPLGELQISVFGFLLIVIFPFILSMIILCAVLIFTGIPGWIGFVLIFLPVIITIVVILWICMKTIWALFKAFANIILLTVFGPLQMALGILIPNLGFGQWVKSYISQLSIFVVTGVLGFLSILFTIHGIVFGFQGVAGSGAITSLLLNMIFGSQSSGTPQVISTLAWPPLLGSGQGIWIGLLFLGVAFILFTMIPKATELVQSFLAGKPFAYGSSIGEAATPLSTFWGYTGGAYLRDAERNSKLAQNIWTKVKSESKRVLGQEKSVGSTSSTPRHQSVDG